jgi:hypothetical protein
MQSDYYFQKVLTLPKSAEAETGSGGDQPVRNKLIEWNGKGGNLPHNHFFHFI